MLPGAGVTSAQDYPSKTIRIIAGTAGGGSDLAARVIAQGISGPLGQPVIVDNRGAAVVAAEAGSKAPPDGYTLLVAGSGIWLFPLLQKAPYDVVRDFSPLSLISREVNIVAVHPSLPVKSVGELIALAKARPGQLNFSGTASGTIFLAGALFRSMAGVNIVNVPYKGTTPALTALLNGEVQLTILDTGLLATHVKSGKLRALAVTSATPSALTPGLPTVSASGLPGYEWIGMTLIFAPAETPAAIISRLNSEIVRALNMAEAKERLLNFGSEVIASSPGQLAAAMKSDMVKMEKVIKDSGIRID